MRHVPGDLIHGKYRLARQIGDGGMGSIFEAHHEALGARVAIKFLHDDLARRPNVVARFLQEARVSATLLSPHIVRVTDMEPGPPDVYLVMELLQGETLHAVLERLPVLEPVVALDIALQILAGLDVAHAANVVHRDLKPENVFLQHTRQGALVKLLDFGIAKLTSTHEANRGLTRPGVVMGTPEYMAPEQAFSADTVDARADIYALGVLLYEMLSGQRPVLGDDPRAVAQVVLRGQATPLNVVAPGLPPGLVGAVHHAMAPDVNHRFASASAMRDALLPYARAISPAARQSLPGYASSVAAWTPAPEPAQYGPPLHDRAAEVAPTALPAPLAHTSSNARYGRPPATTPSVWNPPMQGTPWPPPSAASPQPHTVASPYYDYNQSASPAPHHATVPASPYGPVAASPYATVAASPYGAPAAQPPNDPRLYAGAPAVPLAAPQTAHRQGVSFGWLALGATLLGGSVVALAIVLSDAHSTTSDVAPLPTSSVVALPSVSPPNAGAPAAPTSAPTLPSAIAAPIAAPTHAPVKGAGSARSGPLSGLPPFPSSFPSIPSSLPTTVVIPFPQIPGFPEAQSNPDTGNRSRRDDRRGRGAAGAKSSETF